jgi:methylated-DNA-protein-cysteine methyltransferase-like protein
MFHEKVLIIVSKIPFGKVTSYGAIAQVAGQKSSSRLVGQILSTLKHDNNYPCHRVVNRLGILTGKHNFEPPSRMEELLIAEGHKIQNNTIKNFKEVFWNPDLD